MPSPNRPDRGSEDQSAPPDPGPILERVRERPGTDAGPTPEQLSFDSTKQDEEITGLRQDRKQRLKFGKWIFRLVCAWLGFVAVLIALSGWRLGNFTLSDSVLIALLGTTTVNVIGVLLAVTGYLFPKRS